MEIPWIRLPGGRRNGVIEGMEERGGKAASTVDATSLFCPLPIVKLRLALEDLDPGQVVEILADDPAFPEDLRSWCRETGNRVLELKKNQEDLFLAYVEKGGE